MEEHEAGTTQGVSAPDQASTTDYAPSGATGKAKWFVGAGLLALVGFGAWHLFSGGEPKEHHAPAQVVTVAKVAKGDMPITLDEIGTVTPTATVTVLPNANVSGYLTHVYYKEGQMVSKGQPLAEIDSRPYQVLKQQAQAALAKDEALLAQAKYDFGLYQQLNEKKAIAQQTANDQKYAVQQYVAAVQQDKALIAQYDLDIQYCHIKAPVSGRAGLRLVDEGNYVTGSSSSGIVVLTTVDPMLVQFGVAQNDIGKLATRFNTPGVKLPVTAFDSSTKEPLATGELYALSNQMNTATGQTTMRATFANGDGKLWPNAFVNIRILVDTMKDAVLVPTTSVLTGAPGTYVYIVNADHTVSIRKVAIGPSDGQHTVVTNGLAVGETVVTDGTDRLADHAKIRLAGERRKRPGAGGAAGNGGGDDDTPAAAGHGRRHGQQPQAGSAS